MCVLYAVVDGAAPAVASEYNGYLYDAFFLTQGSNLGLLHCRQILYYLSCQVYHVSQMMYVAETLTGKNCLSKPAILQMGRLRPEAVTCFAKGLHRL